MSDSRGPKGDAKKGAEASVPRTQAGLASSLRVAIGRLSRRIRYEREDDSLTLNQASALGMLYKHGSMPVGELAALERVRPPSMTRIVAGLEDLGLVTREPHPDDRRVVYVHISEPGHARIAADRKRRDAWLNQRLRELTPEERRKLREALPVLERLARS